MLTTTLKTTAFLAAALAYTAAANTAQAEELDTGRPHVDQAQLLKNIYATTDDAQEKFTLQLASKADNDLHAQFAKIDNTFLAPGYDVKSINANTAIATANSQKVFERLVLADAEAAVNTQVVNIEDPFEPHLPMSPFLMAFTIHD